MRFMQFKMAENSLFAILLRSSWWVSLAIGAGIIVLSFGTLPPQYAIFGAAASFPFLVIASIVGWRFAQAPSARQVAALEDAIRTLPWSEFAGRLERAFAAQGYAVERLKSSELDFAMTQGWKRVVVSARRWKVARTGLEPLRELHKALEAHEAHEALYVCLGEVTAQARKFAVGNRIRILGPQELAALGSSLTRPS